MFASSYKKIAIGALGVLVLAVAGCGGGSGGGGSGGGGGGSAGSSGKTGGVTVSNVYSSPKEMGVGDLMYVDFGESNSIDFSGSPPGAEYIFVLSNTSAAGNFSVQMNADLSDADLELAKDLGGEETEEAAELEETFDITAGFHEALREKEDLLDPSESPAYDEGESFSISKGAGETGPAPEVSPAVSAGDNRTFKVLSSLSSSSNTVTVTATAECVGSNVALYVDDRVGQDMLSDADVSALCSQFDRDAGREQELFGSVSDVNGDGKVVALFTPQVNQLGAQGGGIITGFFTANDLYPNSAGNAASNYMEILYIMVPDPAGRYGVNVSREFAMSNLLPSVLVHELQHAISYNQHVFVAGGASERAWLNEGMSHLAEDIFGQGQENPSRYAIFLRNPQAYSLVAGGSPGLAARGAAYLFLRFLYEQHGSPEGFLRRLVKTNKSGVENVEAAFEGRQNDFDGFGEFFLRWSVALAMTDQGISQDRRYTYQPRTRDSETGHWKGACLFCNADDGRGTRLSGVSRSSYNGYQNATTGQSASRFYNLANVRGEMKFSGISGEGFGVLIRKK